MLRHKTPAVETNAVGFHYTFQLAEFCHGDFFVTVTQSYVITPQRFTFLMTEPASALQFFGLMFAVTMS